MQIRFFLFTLAIVTAILATVQVGKTADPATSVDLKVVEGLARSNIEKNIDGFLARLHAKQAEFQDLEASVRSSDDLEIRDIFGTTSWRNQPSLDGLSGRLESNRLGNRDYATAAKQAAGAELSRQSSQITQFIEYLEGIQRTVKTDPMGNVIGALEGSFVPSDIAAILVPDPVDIIAIPPVDTKDENALTGFITFTDSTGAFSSDFPQVAMMLGQRGQQAEILSPTASKSLCTATLVGPSTLVTAAHCICGLQALNGPACLAQKFSLINDSLVYKDVGGLHVFLPLDGYMKVARVAVPTEYEFGVSHDIAVLDLRELAQRTTPIELDLDKLVAPNSPAQIVGYGIHNVVDENGSAISPTLVHLSGLSKRAGLKLVGKISTSQCNTQAAPEATDSNLICWKYGGTESAGTCEGDSGGPMLVAQAGAKLSLVGVTSGGRSSCAPGHMPFSTRVSAAKNWLLSHIPRNSGPTVQLRQNLLFEKPYGLMSIQPQNNRFAFNVGPGETELVASSYANLASTVFMNMHDPDGNLACASELPANFQHCKIETPKAGAWSVTLVGPQAVEYQLSVVGLH